MQLLSDHVQEFCTGCTMLRIMLVVKEVSAYLLTRSGALTMLCLMAWADKLSQHVNQICCLQSEVPKRQLLATILEEDEGYTADKGVTSPCAHIDNPEPNMIKLALYNEYVRMLDVRVTAAA